MMNKPVRMPMRGKSAVAPGRVKAPGTPALPARGSGNASMGRMAQPNRTAGAVAKRPMPAQARVPAAAAKGMAMRAMPRGR